MTDELNDEVEETPEDNDDVISDENDVGDSDDMRSALESAVKDVERDSPEDEVQDADVIETSPETKAEPLATAEPSETPDAEAPNAERKAPVDWSPAEREQWSKVPQSIQEKILARETDIAHSMQGMSDAKRVHDKFGELSRSYAPVLAAEGVTDPMQAVESLFKTVSELRMGAPEQKAQVIANLISAYGVDIQALDSKLVGETGAANPNAQFESIIDQKMGPINQVMEQLNQMQANSKQQSQQQAVQSVEAFGKSAEFLNDVRNDMADLIDLAANQGREITLQQAYDKACALHPEISNVMEQRKQADVIKGTNDVMNNKLTASSSISGRQSGSGGRKGIASMRDQLSQAWDEQGD